MFSYKPDNYLILISNNFLYPLWSFAIIYLFTIFINLKKSAEKIYAIGVALVGCFILSYSMNQIGEILKGLAKSNQKFKERMLQLNQYFSKKELNRDLQLKVIKYYQYVLSQEEECNKEGYNLIQQLPAQLKEEIKAKLYESLLSNKKLFSLNFSKQLIHTLSLKIQEEIYVPQQIIYQKEDSPEKFYFLLSGKGDMIGEYEYFCGCGREQSARSRTVSILAFIQKQDFLEVLSEFPLDKEKYKMIYDQNSLSMNYKTGIMCQSCQSYRHSFSQCPFILYQAPKEKIITEFLKFEGQTERQDCIRRSLKSTKAISIQCYAEQLADMIQLQNIGSETHLKQSQTEIPSQTNFQMNSNINNNINTQIYVGQPSSQMLQIQQQQPMTKEINMILKEQRNRSSIQYNMGQLIDQQPSPNKKQKIILKQKMNPSSRSLIECINVSSQNLQILDNKSQQKITSCGLIEAEQIINPVFGQDNGSVYAGVMKEIQMRDSNSLNQPTYLQKSRNSISQGDMNSLQVVDINLNKKRLSQNAYQSFLNQEDQGIYSIQEQNKYQIQTDKRVSLDSESFNLNPLIIATKYSEQQDIIPSLEDHQNLKFDNEKKYQKQSSGNTFLHDKALIYSYLNEFEKGYDFEIYFPHNNMSNILDKMSQVWKKRNTISNKKVLKQKQIQKNLDNIQNTKSAYKQLQSQSRKIRDTQSKQQSEDFVLSPNQSSYNEKQNSTQKPLKQIEQQFILPNINMVVYKN